MFVFKAEVPVLLNGTLLLEKTRKVHLRHNSPREAAMIDTYRPRLFRFEEMGTGREGSVGISNARPRGNLVPAKSQFGRFALGIPKFSF